VCASDWPPGGAAPGAAATATWYASDSSVSSRSRTCQRASSSARQRGPRASFWNELVIAAWPGSCSRDISFPEGHGPGANAGGSAGPGTTGTTAGRLRRGWSGPAGGTRRPGPRRRRARGPARSGRLRSSRKSSSCQYGHHQCTRQPCDLGEADMVIVWRRVRSGSALIRDRGTVQWEHRYGTDHGNSVGQGRQGAEMAATVLVVEDERKLRDLVRSYLERAGFTVLTTDSGAEAITMVMASAPDLVILDLGLPDVPGETVASEVRANPGSASTPILMLTAKSAEEDRIRGLELGADDYVTKPFSPRELVLRVQAILRRGGPETKATAQGVTSYGGGELVIDEPQRL